MVQLVDDFKVEASRIIRIPISTDSPTSLSYAEGGEGITDPASESGTTYYVDPAGSDSNSGTESGQAWKTVSKASKAQLKPGDMLLFKRGGVWAERLVMSGLQGKDGARITIGAYGTGAAPRMEAAILNTCFYLTVRDLEIQGAGGDNDRLDLSFGSDCMALYNTIHNTGRNALRFFAATRGVAMGNLIYDIGEQDGITIHDQNRVEDAGPSFWIVDNTLIGNSGMEDLIDHAGGTVDAKLTYLADLKIIGNRLQCEAVPGLSQKNGACKFGINSGHYGRGIWIIGNLIAGARYSGSQVWSVDTSSGREPREDGKRFVQQSGNVIWGCGTNSSQLKNTVIFSGSDAWFEYNTLLRTELEDRGALAVYGYLKRANINDNLLMIDRSGSKNPDFAEKLSYQGSQVTRARNHYADLAGSGSYTFAGESLTASETTGTVAGISQPPVKSDPRTWDDAFKSTHFVPDLMDAGAFDRNGVHRGLALRAMSGIGGDGYGWRGPRVIQNYCKARGIL